MNIVLSRFGFCRFVEKRKSSIDLLSVVCLVATSTSQATPSERGPQAMSYTVFDEAAIVTQLNWTSIGLYFSPTTEWMLQLITEIEEKKGDRRMTMMSRLELDTFAQLSTKGFFAAGKAREDRLNVVICTASCVRDTLTQVANVASSIFLRRSRWLLFTDSVMPEITSIGMDNIAAVIHTIDGYSRQFRNVTDTFLQKIQKQKASFSRRLLFPNTHGLGGRTLRVGVGECAGWVYGLIFDLKDQHLHSPSGFNNSGLIIINDAYNQVEYFEPTFETDIWQVLFTMLENQEIDFLITPSVRTVKRERRMDFTFPVEFFTYYVYYKQPPVRVSRWGIMADFLSWKVIVLFVSELIIVSIVLVVFGELRRGCKQSQTRPFSSDDRFVQFWKNTFWILGNFLKQGYVYGDSEPASEPIRCVFAAWCVFCLVLSVIFTAHLVSFLGVSKPKVLFPTLKDLVNNNEYRWGTVGGENWIYSVLKGVKSSHLQELYNKMETFYATDHDVLSMESSVHWGRLDTEKYAYLESDLFVPHRYNNICGLEHINEIIVHGRSGIPMAKNSPYTDLFNEKILELHAAGVIQKITEKWQYRPKTCIEKRTSQSTVDLDMLQNVFYLVAAVLAFSACALCLELAVARYERRIKTTAQTQGQ